MLSLNSGEVHIWTAHLPVGDTSKFYLDLSSGERERADRFRFPKDRIAYVAAHGVLRGVLSLYLQCSPDSLKFGSNGFGKPFLAKAGAGTLEFNLSHSGSLILIGLCADRSIGVDVEEIRTVSDFACIAQSYFTPEEYRFILEQANPDRGWAFFRCWTRKEAYLKAIGRGLSVSLNSFDTLIPNGQIGSLCAVRGDMPLDGEWWLADLDVPKPYVGAVTVQNGAHRIVYFEWRG